jgi:hypothetical protein
MIVHTYIHTYHTYIHTDRACVQIQVMHTYTSCMHHYIPCMYTYMDIHIHTYIPEYINTYIYICICSCILIYLLYWCINIFYILLYMHINHNAYIYTRVSIRIYELTLSSVMVIPFLKSTILWLCGCLFACITKLCDTAHPFSSMAILTV